MLGQLADNFQQWMKTTNTRELVRERVRVCVEQKLSSHVIQRDASANPQSAPWDLFPLPTRQLSLDEKCTILAVIHDQINAHEPVNPFQKVTTTLEDADDAARDKSGSFDATESERDALKPITSGQLSEIKEGEAQQNASRESLMDREMAVLDVADLDLHEHKCALSFFLLQESLVALDDQRIAGIKGLLEEVQQELGLEAAPNTHSEDFHSARWNGVLYVFTHAQAACVKVLWRNFENGTPVISEQAILEESGSLSDHLSDVFEKGRHLSWKTMIVAGEKKGTFRLSETV